MRASQDLRMLFLAEQVRRHGQAFQVRGFERRLLMGRAKREERLAPLLLAQRGAALFQQGNWAIWLRGRGGVIHAVRSRSSLNLALPPRPDGSAGRRP